MKFRLYRQFGALNSQAIFDAFEQGIKKLGHSSVDQGEDVAVIWSVLWNGRMQGNRQVYQFCKSNNIPVMIIEVGNLLRNVTWRLSFNNVNSLGIFPAQQIDDNRQYRFNIDLKPLNNNRSNAILITGQHEKSLQWEGMPSMQVWAKQLVEKIRCYTDRPIVIRPHPRNPFALTYPNTSLIVPNKIPNSYDDFNLSFDYHCIINHNSGPTVQSAINGTPIICDSSGLAYPVSDKMENIEHISLPDRTAWFSKLLQTEWFVDEIESGIPQERLISLL